MGIQIMTDSTCDMDMDTYQALGVEVVPLSVTFEDGTYQDGVTISKATFYEKQAVAKELPKTTQVNPQEFHGVFERALERGDEVVGIFVSAKLSGTYQSAIIAKDMLESDKIWVVDSAQATVSLGILVREAVRLRDAGASAREIVRQMDSLKLRVQFLCFVKTLKYFKMGGRISNATAIVGTMLGISPVVSMIDGELKPVDKVRGKEQILKYTMDCAARHPIDPRYPVAFSHTCCNELLAIYREKCIQALDIVNYFTDEVGAVVGTHAGPGCYGLAYIEQI
ncbi:MAG: DegV family protein [Oscillospiraceae bacterium]